MEEYIVVKREAEKEKAKMAELVRTLCTKYPILENYYISCTKSGLEASCERLSIGRFGGQENKILPDLFEIAAHIAISERKSLKDMDSKYFPALEQAINGKERDDKITDKKKRLIKEILSDSEINTENSEIARYLIEVLKQANFEVKREGDSVKLFGVPYTHGMLQTCDPFTTYVSVVDPRMLLRAIGYEILQHKVEKYVVSKDEARWGNPATAMVTDIATYFRKKLGWLSKAQKFEKNSILHVGAPSPEVAEGFVQAFSNVLSGHELTEGEHKQLCLDLKNFYDGITQNRNLEQKSDLQLPVNFGAHMFNVLAKQQNQNASDFSLEKYMRNYMIFKNYLQRTGALTEKKLDRLPKIAIE